MRVGLAKSYRKKLVAKILSQKSYRKNLVAKIWSPKTFLFGTAYCRIFCSTAVRSTSRGHACSQSRPALCPLLAVSRNCSFVALVLACWMVSAYAGAAGSSPAASVACSSASVRAHWDQPPERWKHMLRGRRLGSGICLALV